jgi:hypothetical protein
MPSRRQNHRQLGKCVDHRPAGKAGPCEQPGKQDGNRQSNANAPRGNVQCQAYDAPFIGSKNGLSTPS